MNNFGSYMLTQNPNSPGNANNVMIVAMSRSPEGHRVMTATWDGSENPKPVFFGSDEMMTLTPEETEARDTMVAALCAQERAALTKELSKQADEKIKAMVKARQRLWFIFAAIGWAIVALLYAIQPLG